MAAPGRQIEGVTRETPLEELARTAIQQRLGVVIAAFPLAAQDAIDDHERVHQLRVATRRAVAALTLFKDFCPRRRARRLLKQLKKIRRAAGTARDLDVFTARLAASSDDAHQMLLHDLTANRQSAQEELVQLYRRLTDDNGLSEQVQGVVKRLRPRGKKAKRQSVQTMAQWSPRRLRKAARQFLAAAPESLHEPEELHPLRVEGKRLRYTLELLSAGLPTATYQGLYPLLEETQDRLGAINDHQVAIQRLKTHASAGHAALEHAVELEQVAMQQAIETVGSWFHDDFLPRLHAALRNPEDGPALVDPETASA